MASFRRVAGALSRLARASGVAPAAEACREGVPQSLLLRCLSSAVPASPYSTYLPAGAAAGPFSLRHYSSSDSSSSSGDDDEDDYLHSPYGIAYPPVEARVGGTAPNFTANGVCETKPMAASRLHGLAWLESGSLYRMPHAPTCNPQASWRSAQPPGLPPAAS